MSIGKVNFKIIKGFFLLTFSYHLSPFTGLDSLAAPFIMLNFDNEQLAFASFNSFIDKYLEGFFSKDNTTTIQEYLALFAHLLVYHDPRMCTV